MPNKTLILQVSGYCDFKNGAFDSGKLTIQEFVKRIRESEGGSYCYWSEDHGDEIQGILLELDAEIPKEVFDTLYGNILRTYTRRSVEDEDLLERYYWCGLVDYSTPDICDEVWDNVRILTQEYNEEGELKTVYNIVPEIEKIEVLDIVRLRQPLYEPLWIYKKKNPYEEEVHGKVVYLYDTDPERLDELIGELSEKI